MSVTIRPWPGLPTYFTVTLRDGSMGQMGQMGCIDLSNVTGYYFHSYAPYDQVSAHDRAQVDEITHAKVLELNTMRAITRKLTA